MDVGDEDEDLARLAELVDGLGLRELGYRVAFEREVGDQVTIKVGHPLLLDNVWHLTNDPKKPGWRDWFRSRLLAWPDVDLVREAVVRPSSVPIVAALRNGAIQARLGESEEVCQGAVHAVSSAALALAAASLLTPDEADWLLRAVEVDQDWFR